MKLTFERQVRLIHCHQLKLIVVVSASSQITEEKWEFLNFKLSLWSRNRRTCSHSIVPWIRFHFSIPYVRTSLKDNREYVQKNKVFKIWLRISSSSLRVATYLSSFLFFCHLLFILFYFLWGFQVEVWKCVSCYD